MKKRWAMAIVGVFLVVVDSMAQMPMPRDNTSVIDRNSNLNTVVAQGPIIPIKVDIVKLQDSEKINLGIFPGKNTADEYIDLELSPYVVTEETNELYDKKKMSVPEHAIVNINGWNYVKTTKMYRFIRYRLCELKRDAYHFNIWFDPKTNNLDCEDMFGGDFIYFAPSMGRRFKHDDKAHLLLIGFYEVLPFLLGGYAFTKMYSAMASTYPIIGMGSHLIATGMSMSYSGLAYEATKESLKIIDHKIQHSPFRGISKSYHATMKNDTKLEVLTAAEGYYSNYGTYYLPAYFGDMRLFKQKLEDLVFDNDGKTLDYAVQMQELKSLSVYPTGGAKPKVSLPHNAPKHVTVAYNPGSFTESYMGSQFGINRTLYMIKLFDELGWFKKN